MNRNDSGHQQWYGAQQNQYQDYGQGYGQNYDQPPPPPPPQWAPYPTTVPMRSRAARQQRQCNLVYSVLRHVSPIVPFIMIIITAYVYIRSDRRDVPADDPSWLPLYLVVPVAVANIIWSFAVMIVQRRSVHRGRPISQNIHFAVELILGVGAAVCFALMIVFIQKKMDDKYDGAYIYFPTSYEGAIAWLLGVQMIANIVLSLRAAYEIKVERSRREQQESFIVH